MEMIHCISLVCCDTIFFPLVVHDVAAMELDILASKLQLEVGYTVSSQEEHALTIQISGLPPTMATPEFIKMSVLHYLMKVEIKIKSCDMFDGVVYVVLEDPSSEYCLPLLNW